jgi:hypothetical protein
VFVATDDFKWPTPTPGDLRDPGGRSDAATSRRIVEWFIQRWVPGFALAAESPLGTIIESVARHERGEEQPLATMEAQVAWEFRVLALRRLDWSIRVLHGQAGRLRDVHGSFVTKELAGVDCRTASWGMPLGVGTLTLAARLMQTSGGEMVITGAGAAGHDIRWEPATGGLALVERKDRAFEIGADEPLGRRARYVVARVREAGPALPREPGAARVLAVGFPGHVPANKARRTRLKFESALADAFGACPDPDEHPDYLIVESVGSRHTPTGGYELNAFYDAIDFGFERPAWKAVSNAFARAYTVEGRRRFKRPWPITA